MRSFFRLSVAAAAVAASALSAPAHAAGAPPAASVTCGFSSLTNPFGTDRQVGEIDGGPIVIADGADPRAGRLTCTIRLGYIGYTTHTGGRFGVSVSSPTMPGVVSISPQLVEYSVEPFEDAVLCTRVDIEGAGTFYWDDVARDWSTDPEVVCTDWYEDPPPDCAHDPVCSTIDLVVCAATQLAGSLTGGGVPGVIEIDAEGDVALLGTPFWDCPPYNV